MFMPLLICGKISAMEQEKDYLQILKERAKKSRVYKSYQFVGLTISQLLNDEKHKSLYIKLAKKHSGDHLLAIAKDVAERKNIENKGGYFMKVLEKTHPYILRNSKSQITNNKKIK
ncbi:hypothetical protein COS33_00185 [Candidatus Wolfebacteria bacterium CG02_land_8_20_14_3_00_37_12]|uniref:Uncharacterized protein n=2 Tax=Candidatus Wolfeibacteriota TaxID=1752735 RepID=A0A2M7Q8D7_9BACT|nr:MAG: hypothetical protein COS33_00185 [Candidatus Wolfebacteria bacterium CG02_land_8_20_14_3_00_37_12]PIY59439.1 MAG: hypothetical protein COY96_01840 [Candidatus Wolfebacteria bacterium CG_4_10_14_0_8_um_filter_37_11]